MGSSTDNSLPLYQRFPQLAAKLTRTPLGKLPTPLTSATSLAGQLGLKSLTIKRDDLSADLYGGNKIRKLEFLLADARRKDCDAVMTYGGLGSNHALATSIYSQQLGLRCAAILTQEPATEAVRKTLAYHDKLGTRLAICEDYGTIREIAATLREEMGGERCYEIPFGGSSWVGAIGFVNAALELADQVAAAEVPLPDLIYMACGTTGSLAGLAVGLRIAGLPTRIEALQVTPESMQPKKLAEDLFNEVCRELRQLDPEFPLLDEPFRNMTVRTDQLGEGYAMPTEAGQRAAELFNESIDLPLSQTYTAKAFAGLVADANAQKLLGQHVMFWNTYNSHPYPDGV